MFPAGRPGVIGKRLRRLINSSGGGIGRGELVRRGQPVRQLVAKLAQVRDGHQVARQHLVDRLVGGGLNHADSVTPWLRQSSGCAQGCDWT